MPPADSGDTRPAASPISSTSLAAIGDTGPPTGMSPPREPDVLRAAQIEQRCDLAQERREIRPLRAAAGEADLREAAVPGHHPARCSRARACRRGSSAGDRDRRPRRRAARLPRPAGIRDCARGRSPRPPPSADRRRRRGSAPARRCRRARTPPANAARAAIGLREAQVRARPRRLAREPAHQARACRWRGSSSPRRRGRAWRDWARTGGCRARGASRVAGISQRSAASFTTRPVVCMRTPAAGLRSRRARAGRGALRRARRRGRQSRRRRCRRRSPFPQFVRRLAAAREAPPARISGLPQLLSARPPPPGSVDHFAIAVALREVQRRHAVAVRQC